LQDDAARLKATPLLSILVANYNNGRFLPSMLESVFAQTYTNWELIVVDDGSTDDSLDVLRQWADERRLRVVEHGRNRGAGAAFATAASASSGEILSMLGADDALRADAAEAIVEAHARDPDAVLINSDLVICDSLLRPLNQPSPYRPVSPGGTLIRDCCVSSFASFKRAAYLRTSGFDERLQRAVDHDLYLKLEEVGRLGYIREPLYLYRTHPGGISQGENGMRAAQFALLARASAYRRRLGSTAPNLTAAEYREVLSTYFRREALHARKDGRLPALSYIRDAVRTLPSLSLEPSLWLTGVKCLLRA